MSDAPEHPWTVLRLINWTRDYFTREGVNSPRLAAEVLLASVLQCPRIELYARYEHHPTDDQRAAFRDMVRRAGEAEPIAYLVGSKEFYSLAFGVTPDVLIPRPETELLVDQAVAHLKQLPAPGRAWDACTGCGCVAIATAVNVPTATVLATDISPQAIHIATQNAAAHGVTQRVTCTVADLLAAPEATEPFDVITANPPYIRDACELSPTVAHEPAVALRGGSDGLDLVRRLVANAPGALVEGGKFIMEFGEDHRDAVCRLLADTGAFSEPTILTDHNAQARAVVAVRP